MSNEPFVSVIITNYNYEVFLPRAVNSVFEQDYPQMELIVVDDGSTDNSVEYLRSLGDKIKLVLKSNGGPASALNAGFVASQGEIICFLDADDCYLPGKIDTVVSILKQYPNAEWCFHALQVEDMQGKVLRRTPPYFGKPVNFRWRLRIGLRVPPAGPTTGLCFQRGLLERILPLPEIRAVGLDDNFLKISAQFLAKGVYEERILAIQYVHGNNLHTNRPDRFPGQAYRHVFTSYWLRRRYPTLKWWTALSFAKGLAFVDRFGVSGKNSLESYRREYWETISLPEKILVSIFYRIYHFKRPWNP